MSAPQNPTARRSPQPHGWSGRFSEPVAELVKRYTASVDFDQRLADVDIAGSLAHARMLAAVGVLSARRPRRHRARHGDDPRRDRARRVRVVARPRGRPPQHREAARPRSSATPASACTPAARATTRSRPTCACGCATRSTRSSRALAALRRALLDLAERARRHDHARLHAPAGRAAGHLRPSPARLRGDARARRRAPRRLPPARQPAAARQRGAGRHQLSDRPRARGARARLRRRSARNSLDAVSDRDFAIEFAAAAALAMVHLSRFAEELVLWIEPALRLRRARRPLLHRLVDHAAEEEPRRARARARQDRPRRSATWSRC